MANKDDLLNLNNNKKNIKKPLIYGAIAFLVFIIAILGFAIYNNASSKQENVVLPPQMKQNQQETMFKEVPIEEEKNTTKNNSQNIAGKLIKNEKNSEKNTTVEIKKTEKTPQTNQKNTEKIKQPVEKTTATSAKPKLQHKKTAAGAKYYVQVAALLKYKKPNKKFLNLIRKEGYGYKLYKTYYVKNGKKIEVTKILIGPFDRQNVQKELNKIKNTITQNAFIYKVR